VGIGTSSPDRRFEVVHSSTNVAKFTGATNAYVDFTDGNVLGRIQMSGNLYFGTETNHTVNFKVGGNLRATLHNTGLDIVDKLKVGAGNNNGEIEITQNTYGQWMLKARRSDNSQIHGIKSYGTSSGGTGGDGGLSFVTDNVDRLNIDSIGNVKAAGALYAEKFIGEGALTKAATAPSSPSAGDLWYNTSNTSLNIYDANSSIWTLLHITTAPSGSQTFNATGVDQTFTVPEGVSSIVVHMWGGAGGGSYGEGYSDSGGPGGYSAATITVTPDSSLTVQVGQGGTKGRASRAYPYGGMGGIRTGYSDGDGGGRSAIFEGTVAAANALIIAGGGGGAGAHGGGGNNGMSGSGGGGGGLVAGHGRTKHYAEATSGGGTQTAGGQSNVDGYQFGGADNGDGTSWPTGNNCAGGGGDGWYGGAVIYNNHSGGGGGSGYLHSTKASGITVRGYSPDDYVGTLYPPFTGVNGYVAGVGRGNLNAYGGNGLVLISWGTELTIPDLPVVDELMFNVESYNTASYPGSGSVWTDTINGLQGSSTTDHNTPPNSTNTPTLVSDAPGPVFDFNGGFSPTTGWFRFPTTNMPWKNHARTYNVWVKFDVINSNNFIGGQDGTPTWGGSHNTASAYGLVERGAGYEIIGHGYDKSTGYHESTAGSWINICVTYDSSTMVWYRNGTLIASVGAGGWNTAQTNFFIGRGWSKDDITALDGKIAHWSIYSRHLTAAEVTSNYNALKTKFGHI
jgi:hypothetical protein